MPDFERLTDKLKYEAATTPEERAYEKGYVDGKNYARMEIAIFFGTVIFLAVLLFMFVPL